MLEVVEGPDQFFLLIYILVGLNTQVPFKLQHFFHLRVIVGIECLVYGWLSTVQVLGIVADRGLQRQILKLRVSSKHCLRLLIATAESQTPLLLDLVVPISKVIQFPNLLDFFQWNILRRP